MEKSPARGAAAALEATAEQGDPEAQFDLGCAYDLGEGVPEDKAEAAKWYRLAADQDHAKAQYYLGNAYHRIGDGVEEDHADMVKWFLMAIDTGLEEEGDQAEVYFHLGQAYDQGKGVPEDKAEAAEYYRLAAELGHVEAQSKLGEA